MFKSENKITIIVPVFNTPICDFERCINSLLEQNNKNFDIIVVDDGSDDYIENYLKKINFNNLKYIYKKNSGVSETRNIGVNNAKTEYVAFCDSDDAYKVDFIDKAYNYINKYNYPDVIIGNIEYIPQWNSQKRINEIKLYYSKDNFLELRKSFFEVTHRKLKYNINVSPCGKIIKRELCLINEFNKYVEFGEDQLFVCKLFDCSKNILVIDDIIYMYYQNQYSATRKKLKNVSFDKYKIFWDEYYKLIVNQPDRLSIDLKEYILKLLNGYINRVCIANNEISFFESIKRLTIALKHPLMKMMLKDIVPFNGHISILNSINVILIKYKFYLIYILEKKIIYKLKINKDKI